MPRLEKCRLKTNVFLVGFMGCGKSTLGKKLAAKLGCPLYDTDRETEKLAGLPIPQIFARYGEAFFREKETEVLHLVAELPEADFRIVVTGGGLATHHDNMDWMNGHGRSVYLSLPPEVLVSRLKEDPNRLVRPLLQPFRTDGQLRQFVTQKLAEREPFYRQATLTFNPLQEDISTLITKIKTLKTI